MSASSSRNPPVEVHGALRAVLANGRRSAPNRREPRSPFRGARLAGTLSLFGAHSTPAGHAAGTVCALVNGEVHRAKPRALVRRFQKPAGKNLLGQVFPSQSTKQPVDKWIKSVENLGENRLNPAGNRAKAHRRDRPSGRAPAARKGVPAGLWPCPARDA